MRLSKPALGVLCATVGLLSCWATTALGETLPDGRVYEMVSSPENHGADMDVPLAMKVGVLQCWDGRVRYDITFSGCHGWRSGGVCGKSERGWHGQ